MNRVTTTALRPGLSIRQISTKKAGIITPPPAGTSDLGQTWVDFGAGPEPVPDDDIDFHQARTDAKHIVLRPHRVLGGKNCQG